MHIFQWASDGCGRFGDILGGRFPADRIRRGRVSFNGSTTAEVTQDQADFGHFSILFSKYFIFPSPFRTRRKTLIPRTVEWKVYQI